MAIVCGTDFSEPSSRAVRAAARLALRMNEPLYVVHAVSLSSPETSQLTNGPEGPFARWAKTHVDRLIEELARDGVRAQGIVQSGFPDQVLLDAAREHAAKLIVVAALGKRPADKYQLGSHAERLAQNSHTPVLVVRDAQVFEDWIAGKRPLRMVLGGDHSLTSAHAMRWANALGQWGPCEVTIVHLYWPPTQFHRLGLGGIRSYLDSDPVVTQALEREYLSRFVVDTKQVSIKLRFETHLGRIGDRLAAIASQEGADLLVLGTHPRTTPGRLWEGSVSRDALRQASTSVVCIPSAEEDPRVGVPPIRNVLVATDFSATGNSAVALAYGVVSPGGTVHLLHVVRGEGGDPTQPSDIFVETEAQARAHTKDRQSLLALVPADALHEGKDSRAHVVTSHDTATAIAQAAERLGADLICLGTHGRSGLRRALMGSVAEAVFEHTHRPVLFARLPPQ